MKKLLIVSGNKALISELKNILADKYEIIISSRPIEVKDIFQEQRIACMIFDITGISEQLEIFIKRIKRFISIPIIVTTNTNNFDLLKKAYESGADDFILLPFNPTDLVMRIDMHSLEYNRVLEFDDLVIDKGNRVVTYQKSEILLTSYEFDILAVLATHVGHAFTKKEIYKRVWKMPDINSTHTVQAHIFTLRKKLQAASNIDYIKTFWKKGYIFQPYVNDNIRSVEEED